MDCYLPDIVGKGYKSFWNFKGRYAVVKGSRASKKSKTAALWIIYNMIKYPAANVLVCRKTFRTLKDSCYSDLQWAMRRLGVQNWFACTQSPLEITYLPTGQKILFRGLDDALKVTSLSVTNGCLCWAWLEEAYELTSEEDFDTLDESIRGEVPEGLFKRWIITFNPWNERHWLKRKFFDVEDPDILALTTNYMCNEWLDAADKKLFERMAETNPRRYQVAGLGQWGIVDGLVYENWREESFELDAVKNLQPVLGLDFGYTNDPTALVVAFLDKQGQKLYIWDEIYKKGLSNRQIYAEIKQAGYHKSRITADSSEPKTIDELHDMGLRIKGAKKGKDSIMYGIQYLQDLEIIVHPRCTNFLTEISNYTWDTDKLGNKLNRPVDDFNHLLDALRYAVEEHITRGKWMF